MNSWRRQNCRVGKRQKELERYIQIREELEKTKTVLEKRMQEERSKVLRCPVCQAEIAEDDRFCAECGASLQKEKQKVCAVCGAIVNQKARFCVNCGTAVRE